MGVACWVGLVKLCKRKSVLTLFEVKAMMWLYWIIREVRCPGLDHIFIWLGPVPPTPPTLPGHLACTCMRTPSRLEPMSQIVTNDSQQGVPTQVRQAEWTTKGAWEGWGLAKWRCDVHWENSRFGLFIGWSVILVITFINTPRFGLTFIHKFLKKI